MSYSESLDRITNKLGSIAPEKAKGAGIKEFLMKSLGKQLLAGSSGGHW
jgi:hypothetical protein